MINTRYFICVILTFLSFANQATEKNEWNISSQFVITDENVYELNVLLPYEHYELESGLRLSINSDDDVDFKLGGNRLFNITENSAILFGGGYGSSSPYVKYGYRHSLFEKVTIDIGYSYFFDELDSRREQVYAGLIYSFGETIDEEVSEIAIKREPIVINDSYNGEFELKKNNFETQNYLVLHFSFDEVSAKNLTMLKAKLSAMISSDADVKVIGHTDSTGSADMNVRVSYLRAKYVADWLVENGLKKSKVTILGMGEIEPIANNETEHGRAQNRRVEVVYNVQE